MLQIDGTQQHFFISVKKKKKATLLGAYFIFVNFLLCVLALYSFESHLRDCIPKVKHLQLSSETIDQPLEMVNCCCK